MTRLDRACIHIGVAAHGAGIPSVQLQKWLDRGQVVLGPNDKDTTGSGDPRLLTPRRVLQFAITAALHQRGLSVKLAASVAASFSDQASPGRAAGELFASGETWLSAAGPLPHSAEVINYRPSPSARVTLAVDLSAIFEDVHRRLLARSFDLAAESNPMNKFTPRRAA